MIPVTPQQALASSQGVAPLPNDPLSGASATPAPTMAPPQLPAVGTGAVESPLSGGPTSQPSRPGVSPSLADQLRQQGFAARASQGADAAAAASPKPNAPGAWARHLVAGAQTALAGLGDAAAVGKVEPGGGWLEGVTRTLAARNARLAQQKQQEFQNKEEQGKNAVMKAYTQAQTVSLQQAAASHAEEDLQKHISAGKAAAEPFRAHHQIIEDNVTEDALLPEFGRGKKYDPDNFHAYQTGSTKVEKDGKMVDEPTYTLFKVSAEPVTVTKEAADILSKYGQPVPEGTSMDGDLYDHAMTQALSASTVTDLINGEAKKEKMKELGDQSMADRALVVGAIAAHPDDPITALGEASKQIGPDGQPTKVAQAAQRLLGNWDPKELETHRKNVADEIAAQAKANAAAAKDHKDDATGDTNLTGQAYLNSIPNPADRAMLQEIGTGRMMASRMEYIIARQKGVAQELALAYPELDQSRIAGYPKLVQDFVSGKTSNAIQGINVVVPHLDMLYSALKANPYAVLPVVGGVESALGNKNAALIQTARTQASQELANAYASGAVTDQEHAEFQKELDSASPLELPNKIENIIDLLSGKVQGIKDKWRDGSPSDSWRPPREIVSPTAQGAWDHIKALQTPEVDAKNVPPAAAFAQVREGQTTTFKNGQQWTRINGNPILINQGKQ